MKTPQNRVRKPVTGIQPERGFAYIAPTRLPALSSHVSPSLGRVLENGIPLPGPANALHEDIRRLGCGRFSFWHDQLYFSAPDNSDPRSNGRKYEIEYSPVDSSIVVNFSLRLWEFFKRLIPLRIREWVFDLFPVFTQNESQPVNFWKRDYTPQSLQRDVEYAAQIGQNFIHWFPEIYANLSGKAVLEIGPGINFGSTLLMACLGAQVSVADPYLAPWDADYHPKFYALLRDWLLENLPQADPAPLDRILKHGGYSPQSIRCYSTPLERLAGIPDASIDTILSNAVLEHLADPVLAFQQMARVSKPGAMGFHQVDFRDHNDFALPLEFLLLNDKAFSKEFYTHHSERGNRYRPVEYSELFTKVGFKMLRYVSSCVADKSYLDEFIPRLRVAQGSRYSNVTIEELQELGGLFCVERNPNDGA